MKPRVIQRERRCLRTGLASVALLVLAGPLCAQDGTQAGIGVDYSRGDYGTALETSIVSVPLSVRVRKGRLQLDASVPWLRVSGDPSVVPSLGPLPGLAPLLGGDRSAGDRSTASGIGDVELSGRYALDTGSRIGIALGARAKIATADADRGLGTGANDYGVGADVYGTVGDTLLFAGVGHDWLGDSPRIDARTQQRASAGLSHVAGRGQVGLKYEQRSALSDDLDGRQEATAFYTVPVAGGSKLRIHASRGLSDGSPDWSVGVGFALGPE